MAPSVLLQPEEQPFVPPLAKQPSTTGNVNGGVSLEVQAPFASNYALPPPSLSVNGGGQSRVGNGVSTGDDFSGRRAESHFVTSQTLLEQSKKIASGTNGGPKKPNILYIMADQMAAPLLKMNDPNSVIKTPHLDELAKTGVVFSSAYCNSPLCAPSRFTMCSGQLPSKIGGYDNASIMAPDVPTYAHYLRSEGYETALAGKMHFIGPDQLHGFEHR